MPKKAKILLAIFVVLAIPIYYNFHKQGQAIDKRKCEILPEEIRGIILKKDQAKEPSYYIDSKKRWFLMKFTHPYDCSMLEIGDSIIKQANNKEVIIKRGTKECVAHLSCSEK